MSLKARLKKIEASQPIGDTVYYMGWANCTWAESEGLNRQEGESKEDFRNMVYLATNKQFLWFD